MVRDIVDVQPLFVENKALLKGNKFLLILVSIL